LITFTRASSGTFVDSAGVIQTATTNEARFDHNPTTGESLGLLVEEARTNSIRNNTNVGAVAGTPGTLPTNWTISGLGTLTQQIVATGVVNGINYIDIRLSGTTSTTQTGIRFETTSGASGTNGQTFTYSVWFARVAGSLSNVTGIFCNANLYDAATAYISTPSFTGFDSTVQPTSLIRRAGTLTIAFATSAFIQPQIGLTFNSGVAIDITLRIGLPQLEQGAFATSVIPTTTATATRSADVASITGANFGTTRTNNIFPSADFSSANWTKTNIQVTASTTTAPDGSTCFAYEGSSASSLLKRLRYNFATTTVGTYTWSIYVKAGTEDSCAITLQDNTGSNGGVATILLTNGTVTGGPNNYGANTGTTVLVQALSNGFYRISLTTTFVAALTQLQAMITWDVNGSSTTTGTLFPWGAQLETGSAVTPYIPTTTAAVSVLESSWYRQDEGTVFVNAINPAVSTTLYAASDGTTNNRIQADTGTNTRIARVVTGGTTQASNNIAYTFGAQQQFALSYVLNSINFANAGTLGTEDTSATIPTVDQLRIGANPTGANALNSTIRRLTYWPTRLANNVLQEVTR